MIIDTYLTPTNIEFEDRFANSVVIMIDVFRASTTVVNALKNGAKELIVLESLEKAVRLYNNLSKGAAILGGERGGIKPEGFDCGNSPFDYSEEMVQGKTVILTTTNGTIVFQQAKQAKYKIIGGFVNINAVCNFVRNKFAEDDSLKSLIILAAGNRGKLSYEDTLAAGAFVDKLSDICDELSESATIARDLYLFRKDSIVDFLKQSHHAKYLSGLGFSDDINFALSADACNVVPLVSGNSVKIVDL